MKKTKSVITVSLVAAAVALIWSCAVNPVTGKTQLMLMSEEQEVAMGLQYDPQVIATFGEYRNDNLQRFLQSEGDKMGRISHRPGLQYHVKILDSPVVNAFAVPGGYIYLTRGILAQLNNEAELIGILGHEMGHITARHSVSQQSKQQLGTLLLIGGMIASEQFAQYAEYAMQGMQLLFLSFSRENEREADRLGVEYSSKVGYDAHKMADFFQVLQKMNMESTQGGVPTFLSTHPDPGDRFNSVNQQATEWQNKLTTTTFRVNAESYLQMMDGIVYGEDPRQGFTDGGIFYHPELRFKFAMPAGWAMENLPTQVNMAPSDGKAIMVFTLTAQKTLDEAAQNAVDQLGLTVSETKKTTVGNIPALAMYSKIIPDDQTTDKQQAVMLLSYFLNYNNQIYLFHGVSAEADFTNYTQAFESTMKSFSVLTDPARLNVKPKRVLVKKVQRNGTLADAFAYYGMKKEMLNELALLNNLELSAPVQTGKLIKIVGE